MFWRVLLFITGRCVFCSNVCVCWVVVCCRQLLFCRVTLGKSFLQFSAMKMAHAPPGHHSVIGRPSVNGLAYAEYVIYRGEQVSLTHTRLSQEPRFHSASLSKSTYCRCVETVWLVFIMTMIVLSHCIPQAYPEYLITYQILKPESTPSSTAGEEQKS